jgi:hypothetical protein
VIELCKAWVLGYACLPFVVVMMWDRVVECYARYQRQADDIGRSDFGVSVGALLAILVITWHCFQVISLQLGWSSLAIWSWTWLYLLQGPIIPVHISQKIMAQIENWLSGQK